LQFSCWLSHNFPVEKSTIWPSLLWPASSSSIQLFSNMVLAMCWCCVFSKHRDHTLIGNHLRWEPFVSDIITSFANKSLRERAVVERNCWGWAHNRSGLRNSTLRICIL
jgi:hypothetical protein